MDRKDNADKFFAVLLLIIFAIYLAFSHTFLLAVFIPVGLIILYILFSGTKERDEYFKAKRNLILGVLLLGVVIFFIYYFYDEEFNTFMLYQDKYVYLTCLFFLIALFMNWFTPKSIPISSVNDDDRLVQETMYEDYDFRTLGDAFLYRGIEFKDSNGKKVSANNLQRAKGTLIPTEISAQDIEMVALNKKDDLKFYYEKVIYDMYNSFLNGKTDLKLLEMYGYNLTIVKGIKNTEEFEQVLKNTSLFYYKLFQFLKKDMNSHSLKLKLNWKQLYADNFYCLEFCLISIILLVRQFINFPVGDMAKYVRSTKDKNFLGCFSSLPADYFNVNSTSASPSGVAYYYIYYKIHLEWFTKCTEEEFCAKWSK